MTNSYADTLLEGQDAYAWNLSRHDNPYVFHTTPWYAWDAGWTQGQREANPKPSDVDLDLEAALVAYDELVQR
jgi:hypothetical protein